MDPPRDDFHVPKTPLPRTITDILSSHQSPSLQSSPSLIPDSELNPVQHLSSRSELSQDGDLSTIRSLTSLGTQHGQVIYATNINLGDVYQRIVKFVNEYKEGDDTEPKYKKLFKDCTLEQKEVFPLDMADVYAFDPILYNQIVRYPRDIIPIIDWYYTTEAAKLKVPLRRGIQVRTFNLREVKHMRSLDPTDIDRLICIRGMVTRVSEIIPDIKVGHFRCTICHADKTVKISKGRIDEPNRCENCGSLQSMQLIHNLCKFGDKQIVKLQETPESIPEGETPHTVNLCVFDLLVDTVKPGDRVDVTGIYRAIAPRENPRMRRLRSLFKTYIDVIHFRKSGTRMSEEDTKDTFEEKIDRKISEEEEQKLKDLAKQPDIYEKLTRAIAPGIFQMDDVKKGILMQLFGGTNKDLPNNTIRGEIHILLMGDPGVSKSQLLLYVNRIAPRGVYTSGKGSSAVGLTAYVTKDQDTGEMVLESGALVLSDLGVCCIDEFDKMNDTTRSILHEVMEQQTVSVAKAGIICSLNARSSILAAANPKESRYNDSLSIVENIQLPPTLLSRFDLIYILKDRPDQLVDRQLAMHIIKLFGDESNGIENEIDTKTLTQYISYARRHIHPQISEEAKDALVKGYIDLRRLGSSRKQITATTRQLESLIRISEAHARMRFSEVVEASDVAEAIRLVRVSIFKAAVDPNSGEVDIDLLTTGATRGQREELERQRELEEQDVDDIIFD